MKNIYWIIIGIIGMAILLYFSKDRSKISAPILNIDTVKTEPITSTGDAEGSIPSMGYIPTDYRTTPSENFLGKSSSEVLVMIYQWPDAQLYDVTTKGIVKMNFRVNNHHHELTFLEDSCVSDVILKK